MEIPLIVVADGLRLSTGPGPGDRGADVFAVTSCDIDGRWAPTFGPELETVPSAKMEFLLKVPVADPFSNTFSSPIRLCRARLVIVSRGVTLGATLLRTGFALNCNHANKS